MGANAAWRVKSFVLRRGGRILSILGVCSFLATRFCYCILLCFGRTVADCPAVENHGGGGVIP